VLRIYCVILLILISFRALASDLVISQAVIHLAPPGAKALAAYMTIDNHQLQPIIITEVSADCCAMAMFHRTRYENHQAWMEQVVPLTIAPGETLTLIPGKMHLMLMGPKAPLIEGDSVLIRFSFSTGQQSVSVPVVRADE